MNNVIKGALIFVAGAVIGSLATFKFAEKKYKKIADEEIESVKEVYFQKTADLIAEDAEYEKDTDAINKKHKTHSAIIEANEYSSEEEKKEDTKIAPYIITPEEFYWDEDEYITISLMCYADGVLADDNDNVIEIPEALIGNKDFLTHFGEYEEDSVYVRNPEMKTQFEILRSERNYYGDIDLRKKEREDE